MERKIIINENFGCYENSEEFVITNNASLVLNFENLSKFGQAFFICEIRKNKKTILIDNDRIILDDDTLK